METVCVCVDVVGELKEACAKATNSALVSSFVRVIAYFYGHCIALRN